MQVLITWVHGLLVPTGVFSDSFHFVTRLGKRAFWMLVLVKGKLPGGPKELYAIKAVEKQRIA
jgi:hypothetical protein